MFGMPNTASDLLRWFRRPRKSAGDVANRFPGVFEAVQARGAIGAKWNVDVSRADVARLHSSLQRPLHQANLALPITSSIWTWAARRDGSEFTKNPASRVGRKPRADMNRSWEAVRRHAVLEGVRLYNLRHSFAGFGAGASLGPPLVGNCLAIRMPRRHTGTRISTPTL
jgi:hypothetical protein